MLEIERATLADADVRPCRGCRSCFDNGETTCPLRDDDMLSMRAKMREADALVLSGPVYVNDVSGLMKNWIDRLAHVCHRPEFAGKSIYLLATVGSTPTGNALRTLRTALSTWGFHIVGLSGFKTGALMKPDEINLRFRTQTEAIARKFYQAIHEQDFARPSFLSLMMFKIQQWAWSRKASKDTLDTRYWKAQGWLEPNCEFYIAHRAGRVKVSLARLTGAVLARFVA
jgi:multimeric flavodoxin WrbA